MLGPDPPARAISKFSRPSPIDPRFHGSGRTLTTRTRERGNNELLSCRNKPRICAHHICRQKGTDCLHRAVETCRCGQERAGQLRSARRGELCFIPTGFSICVAGGASSTPSVLPADQSNLRLVFGRAAPRTCPDSRHVCRIRLHHPDSI